MKVTSPERIDGEWVVSLIEDCGAEHPYSFEFLEEAEEFMRLHQTNINSMEDRDGNR